MASVMSTTYATANGRSVREVRNSVSTRYVADPLGSVVQTRSSAGTQTSSTEFWPFGDVRTSSGTNPSPWGFVGTLGYYTDLASRLYVRARYYRTSLSRWMTVDPLWPNSNGYSYVDNAPSRFSDPTGLLKLVGCGTAAASNQACQPFNEDRQKCLKKFCTIGYIECQPINPDDPYNGICPTYTGPTDSPRNPSGGIIIKTPYGASNFSNNGAWSGRLTVLHEMAHACGVDHGKYGSPSDCQCNDIYACCMFDVLMGRDGTHCVDSMKKHIGKGKKC